MNVVQLVFWIKLLILLQLITDGATGDILRSLPFQSNVLFQWIGSPLNNEIQKIITI